jgi:hypothetical protein
MIIKGKTRFLGIGIYNIDNNLVEIIKPNSEVIKNIEELLNRVRPASTSCTHNHNDRYYDRTNGSKCLKCGKHFN